MDKYRVYYTGYLFVGDNDGYNEHYYSKWEDAISLYYTYGDMISIEDTEYGVTFYKGDWY